MGGKIVANAGHCSTVCKIELDCQKMSVKICGTLKTDGRGPEGEGPRPS
jgi:hypothetical protein